MVNIGGQQEKGLSPHIRGNGMERADRRRTIGSIPAHTGERETDSTDDRSTRVYPRTYGGTADNAVRRTGKPGLSPHIRGNAQFRS